MIIITLKKSMIITDDNNYIKKYSKTLMIIITLKKYSKTSMIIITLKKSMIIITLKKYSKTSKIITFKKSMIIIDDNNYIENI